MDPLDLRRAAHRRTERNNYPAHPDEMIRRLRIIGLCFIHARLNGIPESGGARLVRVARQQVFFLSASRLAASTRRQLACGRPPKLVPPALSPIVRSRRASSCANRALCANPQRKVHDLIILNRSPISSGPVLFALRPAEIVNGNANNKPAEANQVFASGDKFNFKTSSPFDVSEASPPPIN